MYVGHLDLLAEGILRPLWKAAGTRVSVCSLLLSLHLDQTLAGERWKKKFQEYLLD